MQKTPFVSKEKLLEITKTYPTPFHLYDEAGIRRNAQALKDAGYRVIDAEDVKPYEK